MSSESALDHLAELEGILPVYTDLSGTERPTSPETKLALLRANGWELDNGAMITAAKRHIQAEISERLLPAEVVIATGKGEHIDVAGAVEWQVISEDGHKCLAEGKAVSCVRLPPLPSGLHELTVTCHGKVQTTCLIVAPPKAPSVEDCAGRKRLWGVNAALYSLHSCRNAGIGDFEDLASCAEAFGESGAGFLGINPVHAPGWSNANVHSPYSPSHRGFLNFSHIALDRIAPVSRKSLNLLDQWRSSENRQSGYLVDYDKHGGVHRKILRSLYQDFVEGASQTERQAYAGYCERGAENLKQFCRFETLAEVYGHDWRNWPEERAGGSVEKSEADDFHAWLQWHATKQLQDAQGRAMACGMRLGLYLDLAVGARRDGAEAWAERDSIADGVSIGAPPDHLSPAGQNWDLCAYAPRKLASNRYRAFRNILSHNMHHCGVLRIDHVLGLKRSYWIPDDGAPGGYIGQRFETLLALIRIEADRNNCVIIGEDLGLVPDGFRTALKQSGLYSYSVLQYERTESGRIRHPAKLNPNSLACFGTHDTPTLAGFAKGRDIDWWQKLGWIDGPSANQARINRDRDVEQLSSLRIQVASESPPSKSNALSPLNRAVHAALGDSPAAMIAVQLDDLEENAEAQNLPGTINQHPNWLRRSSIPVEQLRSHEGICEMGDLMRKAGRS